jgi:hypothetical protein
LLVRRAQGVSEHKIDMIKSAGAVCLALSLLPIGVRAEENKRFAIVYGPKAAFSIGAPEGWVLGNAKEQGQPCVLYPKGSSWADATVSNRLTDVVGQCAKDSKPVIFDLVFVFADDGHVAQVLQPPDSTVAARVAAKLGNLFQQKR